ncbi:MAG: ATP-binding protein [Phenylobacterium sp.]
MRSLNTRELDDLATALRARRAQVRMRMGLAASFVLLFGSMTGWALAIGWFSIYALLQAVEHRVFVDDRPMTPQRARLALTLLALNSVSFGALALVSPFLDGAWGVTAANLLFAGAILNTVTTNMASRATFIAAVAPFGLYMGAMPLVALSIGANPRQAFLQGAAAALIVVSAAMIWRAASRVYRAEAQARAESERRRAEAQSAVAAKSAFVAIVSHELRTPISAILAGAAELERNADGPARANARLIGDAGAMMRTLLNDLLDMAKLDAGRLTVESIDFDLRSLLADQMRFWRAQARQKGLGFRFLGAAIAPHWVKGDPTRIRQILNNLISNALKFTEAGSVTVRLRREAEPAGALSLSVTDTGPGMSADQMARLFMPFEQLAASTARDHGGTGLGLAISRDLARLMGGDITVESAPGAGASFILGLTLQSGEALPAVAAYADAAGGVTPSAEVLVVDDHEINRRAMTLMLEPIGVVVTCVASANEALDLLSTRAFDVVLMDCHMPGMDGRAATRVLRRTPGPNRATPVIAVTGSVEDDDIRECRVAGMTDYVAKPIDVAVLHAAIAQALRGRGATAVAAA